MELEDLRSQVMVLEGKLIEEQQKLDVKAEESLDLEEQLVRMKNLIDYYCEALVTVKSILTGSFNDSVDYEPIYNKLAPLYDKDGFVLYREAEAITGIDVIRAFPTEDCMGYFENANGHELLDWLIERRFGKIEWEPLNPPYEKAGAVSFEGKEEEIAAFYKELYERTVKRLLQV